MKRLLRKSALTNVNSWYVIYKKVNLQYASLVLNDRAQTVLQGHDKRGVLMNVHRQVFRVRTGLAWILGAQLGAIGVAQGQESGSPGAALQEVVVTAQKRAESVQTVPMSITALSGDELVTAGVTEFRDYAALIPNLSFGYTSSVGALSQSIAIRGIFGRDTTGLYLDESPIPPSVDPRVLDLERIEVLKGPQGSLYGARSMGGTVRLITRQPESTQTEGFVHATFSGTQNGGPNGSADGSINLPLVPGTLAVRALAFYDHQSGVFDRIPSADAPLQFPEHRNVDGRNNVGGQLAAKLSLLDDALTITPRVLFTDARANGRPDADISADQFTQSRLYDLEEAGHDQWQLYTLTAKYAVGGVGEFVSASSLFRRSADDSEDYSEFARLLFPTTAPALITATVSDRQFTQEFRFVSDFSDLVALTTGLFFQDDKNNVSFPTASLPDPGLENVYTQSTDTRTTERAAFGEVTVTPIKKLKLTAGGRYYRNSVTLLDVMSGLIAVPATNRGTERQSGTNPKFGAQYLFSSDAQIYANASKGFRPGGPNSVPLTQCGADITAAGLTSEQAQSFNADSVWSYELGTKTSWLDRRLTFNAAVYMINWDEIRQSLGLACGFPITVNAGRARSDGGEVEFRFRASDSLTFWGGAGYTDARIVDSGGLANFREGSRIQQVPRFNSSLGLDFRSSIAQLPVLLHIDHAYVGESVSTNNASSRDPRTRGAYQLVNLRGSVTLGSVEAGVFVDNLFDKLANLGDSPPLFIELPGRPRIVTGRPRTIGVDARLHF